MKTYDLSDTSVQSYLADVKTVVLASINPNGSPLATPVWFVYDQTHLAMVSVDNLRKVKNLRRDPRLSIVAESDRDGRSICLMVKGIAQFTDSQADRAVIGRAFVDKYGEPMRARWGGTCVPESRAVWRIEPLRITAWGWD